MFTSRKFYFTIDKLFNPYTLLPASDFHRLTSGCYFFTCYLSRHGSNADFDPSKLADADQRTGE